MKTQKEISSDVPIIDGQISLDDILANVDDGTYGKPSDEFEVRS